MRSLLASLLLPILACACAGMPDVHQEAYAKLRGHRTFEYEFPRTWKAIETVFANYHLVSHDSRALETDWIYGRSRDKYIEYQVNDTPRRRFLQTRVKFNVTAEPVLGGTDVTVRTTEEIERLNADGSSAGFERVDDLDTSRPAEILDKIGDALLAAPSGS